MSENEAPPAKRMRYNLRSSARLKSNMATTNGKNQTSASNRSVAVPHHSAYKLRSSGKINDNVFELTELPRKRKKMNLLALNQHCLLKMFEYMNLVDLCSLAETCTTLSSYAKYYFRLKYKHFDFASMFDGELLSVDMAQRLLRIFGDQIRTLKISRDLFEEREDASCELLHSIGYHCRAVLKVLVLDGIDFMPCAEDCLATLFGTLEAFIVDQCDVETVNWWSMNNLKVLKLKEIDAYGLNFWRAEFDQLEVVELESIDVSTEHITDFIRSVPPIKRLSIVKCPPIKSSIFSAVKNLTDLEEFEFQLNHPTQSEEIQHRDLMHLTALKKLKVLKFNCNKWSVRQLIDELFKNKIAIEHLELADGRLDTETVEAISKLKTIKVLKLNDMIDFAEGSIVSIATALNQLEELHIKTESKFSQFRFKEIARAASRLTCLKIDAHDFNLNIDTYQAILTTVQKREHNNHLAITIYGDANQLSIPQGVLIGPNEKWLSVNIFNRYSNHLFPLYAWLPGLDLDDDDMDGFEFDDDDEMFVEILSDGED